MKIGSSMLSASCLCAVIIGAFSFQHSRVGILQSLRPFARKGLTINTKLVNEDSQPMISIIEESRKYDNVGSIDSWMTPENVAILSVYFVQGALGLSRLDQLHFSPTEMAAIGGLTSIPWIIKPLYGFLSDGIPIQGYKRRSYLALSGILGSLSWLALGTFVTDSNSAIAAIVLGSASVAISDVVADSIVVERSRVSAGTDDTSSETSVSGDLQSLCWGAAAVGGILSAYFSGSLLQITTAQNVFLITAIFPLMVTIASFFIAEERSFSSTFKVDEFVEVLKQQLSQLKETLLSPSIYLPVLFIFMWRATPSPDSAMFYFSTNDLKFQPEFLGRVSLAASVASLAGVTAYKSFLKDISIKTIIYWSTIASCVLSMTQILLVTHINRELGIPDTFFALTDTIVLTVLGQVAFMPTLVLAASLCPPGIEGTLFATLMSIYNASGIVSQELGAGLTSILHVTESNFDNLPLLVFLCSISSVIPLPFIGLLDKQQEPKVNQNV